MKLNFVYSDQQCLTILQILRKKFGNICVQPNIAAALVKRKGILDAFYRNV